MQYYERLWMALRSNVLGNGRSHIDGVHKLLGEPKNFLSILLCHILAVRMSSVIAYPSDSIAPPFQGLRDHPAICEFMKLVDEITFGSSLVDAGRLHSSPSHHGACAVGRDAITPFGFIQIAAYLIGYTLVCRRGKIGRIERVASTTLIFVGQYTFPAGGTDTNPPQISIAFLPNGEDPLIASRGDKYRGVH